MGMTDFKKTVKKLVGIENAGRNLTVRNDDVFVVSYPKSGNTWTRFLIANLISASNEEITFLNIENKVPDIYQNTDRYMLNLPCPRVLKSHEYFDPRYKKVIYIVRDPRDVVVSYYYHFIKFLSLENNNMDEFVQRFVQGNLDVFGSWGENVGSWLATRGNGDDFLLIKYEDLLVDTGKELEKVAAFLRLQYDQERLQSSIKRSSSDNMRKLETIQANHWKITKNTRKDIQFVRSAKAGGWKEVLSPYGVSLIQNKWRHLLYKFGYIEN
jgi:hypothetical protein